MLSSTFLNRSPGREFILAIVAAELFMILFFLECHAYDLATALIFALALAFLARGHLTAYYVLFPIGCLNRETMVLMTLVYVLHMYGRPGWIRGTLLQLAAFILIRAGLVLVFAGVPGAPFWFRPIENLQWFARFPWLSLVHWSGVALVLWLCLRRWSTKPRLLQQSFLVLAPALMVLYLAVGWAFEVRVFAEIYPTAYALAVLGWF